MAIISIIGTSGVGKSFLVKQLASYDCLPAFFEGEEGTIPEEVMRSIFSGKDTVWRYQWFVEHFRKTLERAREVSQAGLDCYVDGSPLTPRAIMICESQEHHGELTKLCQTLRILQAKMFMKAYRLCK